MKKKIFLMGPLRSGYVQHFIENVLEPLGLEIYMQIQKKDLIELNGYISEHKINTIKLYEKDDNLLFRILFWGWFLRAFLNVLAAYKFKPFDYIHIQYVTYKELFIANYVKTKYTKCYASFFGSDLLRQSEKYLRKEEKLLGNLSLITADGYTLKKSFDRIFPDLNVKFQLVAYGVSLLPYIDKYSDDVTYCKQFFSFPLDKKIIAIGYNAIKEQQHDKVLDELISLKNKSEYYLVFQMSYGEKDNIYLSNLFQQIKNSGFEYKVIEKFLSMDELAKLRIATDIFINAQTTDAFANSFIENLYSKSVIINASWLHYPEIDMFPLYVNEFSNFSEICLLLNKTISSDKLSWNKKSVENRTWDLCKKKWEEIYDLKPEFYVKS